MLKNKNMKILTNLEVLIMESLKSLMIHPSKVFCTYINISNTILQKTDLLFFVVLQHAFLSECLFPPALQSTFFF